MFESGSELGREVQITSPAPPPIGVDPGAGLSGGLARKAPCLPRGRGLDRAEGMEGLVNDEVGALENERSKGMEGGLKKGMEGGRGREKVKESRGRSSNGSS